MSNHHHKNKKYPLFIIISYIGVMCIASPSAFASQGSNTLQSLVPTTTDSSNSNPYRVDIGQGWYECDHSASSCSLWNVNKVVNVDSYKNISYDIGDFSISFPKGRPTITSEDGRFAFAVGGMFQYDIGGFVGSNHKDEGMNMSGVRNHLRRGRFIVTARYDDFLVTFTPDFGTSGVQNDSIFEASLKYQGIRHTSVEIGLLQPRVTMEDVEGSNGFEFVERPMVVDLVRNIAAANARLSFGATHWEKKYYVAAYVTGPRYGPFYNFQDNQIGGVMRVAGHVIASHDWDVMLGASGSFAFHGADRKYSMNTGTEAQIWLSRPYIKTGSINGVDSLWSVGPQIGIRWKRFFVKSEYYTINMQRVQEGGNNQPNLHFPGWYISTNYTLFGQPRLYDEKKAVFSPPVGPVFNPSAGYWGALEWSARWSVMDLNSHKSSYSDSGTLLGAHGGKQTIWSTGFNWYLSPNVRVMLDYNHIKASPSLKSDFNVRGRHSNLIISRLQLNF